MKKLLVLFISVLMLCGCDISNSILKNEYSINEKANIDNIDITMKDVSRTPLELEVTFEITNLNDFAITVSSDNNFYIFDNNIKLSNKYENTNNIIKKNQTIMYTVRYEISKRELYNIYFYSNITKDKKITFNINSQNFKD